MMLRRVFASLNGAGFPVKRADLFICAALAALTLAVSLYFAPRGHHYGFVDMGQDGYQLKQAIDLSHGNVIFRDTFDQYGPLNGYLNTVGFLMSGRRLLGIKFFLCGWYAVIAIALFVMARRWLSSTLAAFSTVLWLGLSPFPQHGVMISPHVYVLFFQTLALLLVLSATRLQPGRFALAGVLTGVSWAMKQSMGGLLLASLLLFLLLCATGRRTSWARALQAAAATGGGFGAVVGGALLLLWFGGALHDWYMQTIVFPRIYYLNNSGSLSSLRALIAEFVNLQATADIYWLVIRLVVIIGGIAAIGSRYRSADFLLMASVTACLWLGAFPSANFMHQWWTSSLSFAPFVACVWLLAGRMMKGAGVRSLATMTVTLSLVVFGLGDRVRAARARARDLTETMVEPMVLRGIRTNLPTKRIFETLYQVMAQYRSRHPGTRIVSMEAEAAPESLLFLSFFEPNPHAQPVYWSQPGLADHTYPDYLPAFWQDIASTRPLIVDHRLGPFRMESIPRYSILFAAPSDYGYWYLYAPDDGDRTGRSETPIFLNINGTETALPRNDAEAVAAIVEQPNNWNVHGSLRQKTAPAVAGSPVGVYTWPADLPLASVPPGGPLELVSDKPVARAGAVTHVAAGSWKVDGRADDRYSYLLQFAPIALEKGSYFVARGNLINGGLTIGVTRDDHWYGVVNVTERGPFLFVLQVQSSGPYQLTVANCIESQWMGTLGLVTKAFFQNHFDVTQAGWIRPPASADRPR